MIVAIIMVTMYLRPCTCIIIITWYVCFSQKCFRKVKTKMSGVSCHKSGVKNIMHNYFFCSVKVVWLHFSMTLTHLGLSIDSGVCSG